MARQRNRFPKIFIAHPFKKFPVKKFRDVFYLFPFTPIYGNSDIETKPLLHVIKRQIQEADYCIFDLTDWNPNVALELGLVEGFSGKPHKQYYVLLNNKNKDVPSDIKGLQRLEYSGLDINKNGWLGNQLLFLLKKEYYSLEILKKLKKEFDKPEKIEKAFMVSMKIIGHLKHVSTIQSKSRDSFFQGGISFLKDDKEKVYRVLHELRILKPKGDGFKLNSKTNIFPK